ncbi:MAG: CHAT domain-containing protein [Candidatus Aphodosoma sp.]
MKIIIRFLIIILISSLGGGHICAGRHELDSIAFLLENGDIDIAHRQLERYANKLNSNEQPDFHYYFGLVEELSGNTDEALKHYYECMLHSEQKNQRDESYLDAAARSIHHAVEAADWLSVARLSRQALTAPDSVLNSYPNTFNIYDWYVGALNTLGKYEDIPMVARQGQKYSETMFRPTDKAYYNLRISEIVALLLMNKWDEADRGISIMDSISQTTGNDIMRHEIDDLSHRIRDAKRIMNWRVDADKRVSEIFDIANSLLLQSPASSLGKKSWDTFFYSIISQLELFYFDINNPDDEKYWSRLLACAIVYFNIIGDVIPEREMLAYDLILLRKNFLDYHSGLLHKSPKRWQMVKNSLAPGELAIEITMCPEEILLLSNDFLAPVAIPIPDAIITQIEQYNIHDAASISEFYSENSPLVSLINLLSPYLADVHTLYLSPTNLFAQFNYGAIPYKKRCLDDHFDVVQMSTTADIGKVKDKAKIPPIRQALLYGGIDYGDLPSRTSMVESPRRSELVNALAETRSGFGYLPHSLAEVESIAAIIQNSSLYTGTDASEQRIKSIDWPRMDGIFHIATHGYSLSSPSLRDKADNISNIMSIRLRSGLLLADANYSLSGLSPTEEDGILTSQEIATLDMGNVELAVLSACSSGMGDLTNTTGVVYGVANAIKSAGVKRILATLWDIPDEASALAMQCFYKHLTSERSIAHSLRLMRQDMKSIGYANPFYWAPFIYLE